MKIVLDMQGAQSNSRLRGIGRYTLSMAKAFAKEAVDHELWLMLNGRQDDSSADLLMQFDGLIPRERIVINELPAGIAGCQPENYWRIQMAAAAQASRLADLQADFVWHSSMFEGWGDDSVVTLGDGTHDRRHVATLYDLIPLLSPSDHLQEAAHRHWYHQRLGLLKRCGLLLAISESSRREAIDALQVPEDRVEVVSGAPDSVFRPMPVDAACWARWQEQWRLRPDFVLYAGGFDVHKNVQTLIAAYADLTPDLRRRHPLVLAGRCGEAARKQLQQFARRCRLNADQLIFTGELDDLDLARLYSTCTLFVAPSLHEGLGLPPLEAMACGAAVIGSNTSSLPEVIGRPDALFDPRSRSDMGAKLHAVLVDAGFRESLREHAVEQSRKFSWSISASKALAAIERHAGAVRATVPLMHGRPRLIYVSPLPPVRSGIGDYSARLLRDLATHYDIEVVIDQPEMLDPWVLGNFPIRTLQWFVDHAASCERRLYHFGNSPFHAHMFGMLQQWPGIVVLHDSFLGASRNWMAHEAHDANGMARLLYDSHGYAGMLHDREQGRLAAIDAWPVNRDVIEQAYGVIVHSRHAVQLAGQHYGAGAEGKFSVVPFPKERTTGDSTSARRLLGIAPDDFVVCSFGMLAPTKLNHRLLAAWLQSTLSADAHCHLIFVGENHGGDYGAALLKQIDAAGVPSRIRITGFVTAQTYSDYLNAADLVVQLRKDSRGETSAAVFDALAHGLPLIVNNHGSAAELDPAAVFGIADRFDDSDLVLALQSLRSDANRRQQLAGAALVLIAQHHPAKVASQYRDAIERFIESPRAIGRRLQTQAEGQDAATPEPRPSALEWQRLMAANHPAIERACLYVDVTAIAQSALHTGIERVVRGVLSALLRIEQSTYRIEPVRLERGRYVRATAYALKVLDHAPVGLPEEEVFPRSGDTLFGLDWVADALPANTALLEAWRLRGVRMLFVVYDLLPVRQPEWFPPGLADMHAQWLRCIGTYADGLLCISRFVAEDVRHWFDQHPPCRRDDLALGYFYPGNDPAATRPTAGLPDDAKQMLARFAATPTFLMVGTVEPRKGHALVLDAFEQLWSDGAEVNLVVVGREGWMSAAVAKRMRLIARSNGRLTWLEQASDEYLELIYASARALIAASAAEGFGLPLVEAARHRLPVIARDITVFREVSSAFASYFNGDDVQNLIDTLRRAMTTKRPDLPSDAASVLGWKDTTDRIYEMLGDARHAQWLLPWSPAGASPETEKS